MTQAPAGRNLGGQSATPRKDSWRLLFLRLAHRAAGTMQSSISSSRDAPQHSLTAHAASEQCDGDPGVLARKLARVRAIPDTQRPLDGASWVRCEELQDELKAALGNWHNCSEDGRCDESVRAVTVLLAAVDAAPAELEVRLAASTCVQCFTSLVLCLSLPADLLSHLLCCCCWWALPAGVSAPGGPRQLGDAPAGPRHAAGGGDQAKAQHRAAPGHLGHRVPAWGRQ